MATRTSTQDGLASESFDGEIANGDSVVILEGHEILWDLDHSGFATGLAALTINGRLDFKHDAVTCLKMNGNITGSGELHVGTESNPIQRPAVGSESRCQLIFNSTGQINVPIVKMYGWYPELEFTQLDAPAVLGATEIVLQESLDLQAGDKILIGSGTELDATAEASKGIYTVQSYNAQTKTVTLSAGLQTARLEDDYVAIYSRPIKIMRTSGYNTYITSSLDLYNEGVLWFLNGNGKIISNSQELENFNGGTFKHCTADPTFATHVKDIIIEDSVSRGQQIYDVFNPQIRRGIVLHALTCSRQLYGVGCYEDVVHQNIGYPVGLSEILIKNCVFKDMYMGSVMGFGSTYKNCVFKDIEEAYPYEFNGGLISGMNKYIDCIFDESCETLFQTIYTEAYNCLFGDDFVPIDYSNSLRRVDKPVLESFDHDQNLGNYQAWMRGGTIETQTIDEEIQQGKLIFKPESADYPVFYDRSITLPEGRTANLTVPVVKSIVDMLVKLEIFKLENDPLFPGGTVDDMDIASDTTEQQDLTVIYTPERNQQVILRVSATGTSGEVMVDMTLFESLMKKSYIVITED